jgi:hypothetical protein
MFHHEAAAVAGRHLGHAPRDIVGLAAGIHENARVKMRR